jgi:hypothetical protein
MTIPQRLYLIASQLERAANRTTEQVVTIRECARGLNDIAGEMENMEVTNSASSVQDRKTAFMLGVEWGYIRGEKGEQNILSVQMEAGRLWQG